MAARIPAGTQLVGPFPDHKKPARKGLYLRVSRKSGKKEWAYYGGPSAGWGTFSSSPKRALKKFQDGARSHKDLDWFGATRATAAQLPPLA